MRIFAYHLDWTTMDIQKKAMIEALETSLGIVSDACRKVGIVRQTHYNWMKNDEEYREAVKDIDNIALDFAESQLFRQIRDGEIPSTIFYLKTKGKHRGYVERSEQQIEVTKPIIIDWNDNQADSEAEGGTSNTKE